MNQENEGKVYPEMTDYDIKPNIWKGLLKITVNGGLQQKQPGGGTLAQC